MKAFSLGIAMLGTLTITGSALAADLQAPVYKSPPPPHTAFYSWTGLYAGGHLGGGWAQSEWSDAGGVQPGFVGGVQAGFNYQTGQLVWGIEGDWSSTDIKASSNCFEFFGGGPQSCISQVKWTGTLTGRFGVASDRTLFYAKGGAAWARQEY